MLSFCKLYKKSGASAQTNDISVAQKTLREISLINNQAILLAELSDIPRAVDESKLGVMSRDGGIGNDDIIVRFTPDADDRLGDRIDISGKGTGQKAD